MIHDLKTWPEFFVDIKACIKTFELRRDDRRYAVGDTLHLREWDPKTEKYTGQKLDRLVIHLLKHRPNAGCAASFGLSPDYVILSIAPILSLPSTDKSGAA